MCNNIEKAGRYLEAAKINQENLWKRREIEWKINFALWTAIALVTGFLYLNIKNPINIPCNYCVFIVFLIVYAFTTWLYSKHIDTIRLSNDKDKSYMIYYLTLAEIELLPIPTIGSDEPYLEKKLDKY